MSETENQFSLTRAGSKPPARQKTKFLSVCAGLMALGSGAIEQTAYTQTNQPIETLKTKAEVGDAEAQFNLGVCYFGGLGLDKDVVQGAKWYRKAAAQGHAKAQSNLGLCYANGNGVPKDASEAVMWYGKAADQGDIKAQERLGECYLEGRGVTKDASQAVKWFRKAAEQGHDYAQNNLGACYRRGEGVAKDAAEAAQWFRKAADQGCASAENSLAICYTEGEGVSKDMVEAARWFHEAADQGDAEAQFNLGVLQAKGVGIPVDMVQAYKWFSLADAQRVENAKKCVSILENKMTRAQIIAGQQLARDFKLRQPSKGRPSQIEGRANEGQVDEMKKRVPKGGLALDDVLRLFCETVTSKLPMDLGNGMRLVSITPGPGKLLNYTLTTDVDPPEVRNPEAFRRGMKSILLAGYRDEPGIQLLREKGVELQYRFKDRHGKDVTTVTISPGE